MEDETQVKKRAIAQIKTLDKVNKDEDIRVSVVGTIVDIDTKSLFFTIDDGTKKVSVILNHESQIKDLKLGKIVRVIGLVVGFEENYELRGEIVQDFTGLNVELYNKYLAQI